MFALMVHRPVPADREKPGFEVLVPRENRPLVLRRRLLMPDQPDERLLDDIAGAIEIVKDAASIPDKRSFVAFEEGSEVRDAGHRLLMGYTDESPGVLGHGR